MRLFRAPATHRRRARPPRAAPRAMLRAARLIALALVLAAAPALPACAQDADAAHQQFVFAYKLLQRGDHALAADAFDQYLGSFPEAPKRSDAAYYRALLHRRAGDPAAAAELLEQAQAPELVPPYAVGLLRGQVALDLGRFDDAVAALERIDLSAAPDRVAHAARLLRGRAYRGAGNRVAAEAAFQQAAQAPGEQAAAALVELGRVRAELDQPDAALDALRRAAQLGDPVASPEAARLAGDLAYRLGRRDRAIDDYNVVLSGYQSSPHFGPALVGTLWAHHAQGRDRAVLDTFAAFETAVPADHRAESLYVAALAHQRLGDHAAAAEALSRSLDAPAGAGDTLRPRTLYRLALARQALGDRAGARAAAEKLLRDHAASGRALDATLLLAELDEAAGEPARAAARLTKLLQDTPDPAARAPVALARARLFDRHGESAAALADYTRYLDAAGLDPASAPEAPAAALRAIGLAQELGRHDRAQALARRVLEAPEVDPATRAEARFRLALALIRLDQPEAALAELDALDSGDPLHARRGESAYYRGLLLLSLGRDADAAEPLAAAADHDTLGTPMRVNALRLLALHHAQAGRLGEAADVLARLERLAGPAALKPSERLTLSRAALGRGDAGAALAYAEPVRDARGEADPTQRAEAWLLHGRALLARGDAPAAAEAFERVVAMGRGFDHEALLHLAEAHAAMGELQRAAAELAGLMSHESGDLAARALLQAADVYRQLARQHRGAGRDADADAALLDAEKRLKRLLLLHDAPELAPLARRARLELAGVLLARGQTDERRNLLRELAEGSPGSAYGRLAQAMLTAESGRVAEAQQLLAAIPADDRDPAFDRLAEQAQARWRQPGGGAAAPAGGASGDASGGASGGGGGG